MSNILAVTHDLLETISDFLLILYIVTHKKCHQNKRKFLCKITICSTFPLTHQNSSLFPESARPTQKVFADESVLQVLSLLSSFLLMSFPYSQFLLLFLLIAHLM
nr:MAG TPA: hypothetical protein [Caudoviricetes sp.]